MGIALVAGLLAAFSAHQYLQDKVNQIEAQGKVQTVARIVAAYDLPAGTTLQTDHMAIRHVPTPWVISGSLSPDEVNQIEGQVLNVDLRAGDPLLWAHTAKLTQKPFSEKINIGRRAVTLPVDILNSASGMLEPGDFIDLYVSFTYRQRQITAPLLQGVLVMATGQRQQGTEDDTQSFSTVTLDTSPEEAAKLVAARQAGTLTALLRNPKDAQASQKGVRGDLATILGIAKPPPAPKRKPAVVYGNEAHKKLPTLPSVADAPAPNSFGIIQIPGQDDLVSDWLNSLNRHRPTLSQPKELSHEHDALPAE